MIFNYHANLFCSGAGCITAVQSKPQDNPKDAFADAKRAAALQNWTFQNGDAFCDECTKKEVGQ